MTFPEKEGLSTSLSYNDRNEVFIEETGDFLYQFYNSNFRKNAHPARITNEAIAAVYI